MVRIGISVEGSTEELFVKTVLQPHFQEKDIFVTPKSLRGHVNVDRVGAELKKLCHGFDYITTFYDFYGFQRKQPDETKHSLENRILNSVPEACRSQCIPYVQMYEFEGLLFSSPSAIATVFRRGDLASWAATVLQDCGGDPELINNTPETAPKRRLKEKTRYRETTHGPLIAKEIGLDVLRDKCTGFGAWLTRLEGL